MGILDSIVNNAENEVESDVNSKVNSGIGKINKIGSSSNLSKCPKCNAPLPSPSPKFCPKCGAKLILTCPKCKTDYPLGTKFCTQDGTKLS